MTFLMITIYKLELLYYIDKKEHNMKKLFLNQRIPVQQQWIDPRPIGINGVL